MLSFEEKQIWLNAQFALALEPKNKEHADFCEELAERDALGELGGELSEFVEIGELRLAAYLAEQQSYIDEINRCAKHYFDVFFALFSAGSTIKEVHYVLDQLNNRDEWLCGDSGAPDHEMDPKVVKMPQRLVEALGKLSVGTSV
jgi:hypothetical protein